MESWTIERLKDLCLSFPDTEMNFPFDDITMTIRVGGRIFALAGIDSSPLRVNLKCDPGLARELRASWPGKILPGWHMNKEHWNTVVMEGSIPDETIEAMIRHSYECVKAKLPGPARICS